MGDTSKFNCNGDIKCNLLLASKKLNDSDLMKDNVWPHCNKNFNYSNYTVNTSKPSMDKIRASGTSLADTFSNIDILVNELSPALITSPMPGKEAVAGVSDLKNCTGQPASCKVINNIRASCKNKPIPPDLKLAVEAYNSNLLNLVGENASSYFMKIGCYKDSKGNCVENKYALIDNGPPPPPLQGQIPGLANDLLKFSPDKLISIFLGGSVDGFTIIPRVSKDSKETFQNNNHFPEIIYHVCPLSGISTILIIFIIMIIVCRLFK